MNDFHKDRLSAILRELWAARSLDLHMCDGTTKQDQFGLLQNIREDVSARIIALEEENKRLREALEPFASLAHAILAEAPHDVDEVTLWKDCDGLQHKFSMDFLRSVKTKS